MKKDDDYNIITKIVTDMNKIMRYDPYLNYYSIGFLHDVLVMKQEKWNL